MTVLGGEGLKKAVKANPGIVNDVGHTIFVFRNSNQPCLLNANNTTTHEETVPVELH
jgi:hypothetical protein